MFFLDDTIAAIASAPGGAARGIIRLSGPQAVEVVNCCFQANDASLDLGQLRRATALAGTFNAAARVEAAPANELILPVDLLLWPTTRSYTRQPLAEIHTFGSPPLLNTVMHALCQAGARPANPGEFTLRAFLGGRIDLIEAEAVLGVVDAANRRQLETALDQLAGGLSRPLKSVRGDLLDLLADLEAGLDFVEDDIRFVQPDELQRRLNAAAAQLAQLAQQLSMRGLTIGKPRVALVGLPNVGKSSLFNALASDGSALVSPQPGTTRDYLIVPIDADGLPVELIDTAGIDSSEHSIDSANLTVAAAAHSQAIDQHRQADLLLHCYDATRITSDGVSMEIANNRASTNTIVVLTKCDLLQNATENHNAANHVLAKSASQTSVTVETSSHTGLGLVRLRRAIREALSGPAAGAEVAGVAATSVRIGENIALTINSLTAACELAANQSGEELVAAEIRTALSELGKIIGVVYTEDLLDRIFSRFCIGK